MIKKFLILIISIPFVIANNLEIQSNEFIKKGNFLYANDEIILYKPNYYAKANSGVYNEDTNELELVGDVFIISKNQTSLSSYAKINLKNSCTSFDNFFISSAFMELWLKSEDSKYEDNKFIVNNASLSSCNVNDPEWELFFTSGSYDSNSKDLVLKNMVFKYHGVPIFYMPYITINTDDSRKTGFLTPKLAIHNKEDAFYEQPFFWAINHRMDLELRPQIRTNRGYGLYANYRFVDSLYSSGYMGAGYFNEFNNYVEKENLKYKYHVGFNMHYERDKIFNDNLENQEGFYFDFLKINDVDFLNLSSFHDNNNDAIITSRANYFYTDNKDYYGMYLKYYQDTSKLSQSSILQEIPNLQYYRFYDSLFNNLISYKFDANYNHFYRNEGSTLNRFNFYMPIELKKGLFNNFINFVIKEELESNINIYNKYHKNHDITFNATHSAALYTNLLRKYNEITHNISLGASVSLKQGQKEEENEFYIINSYDDVSVNIELAQLFYKNKEKKLKHYLTLKTYNKRFDIISNQFKYYFTQNFYINNILEYSFKTKTLDKLFVETNYKTDELSIGTGYFYNKRQDILSDVSPNDKFLSAKIQYEFIPHNIIYSRSWYNINSKKHENYSIGFIHKRKCINYTLEFKESTNSKLTQKGIKSTKDRGIYLKFNLYPIGGVKYNFALRGDEDYDF